MLAARVAADALEEHLEGGAVEQVLARMDLVADVDAVLVEGVEDRLPAPAELGEGLLDQARRPLRPGIEKGPGQRAGEGRHAASRPRLLRRLSPQLHLLDRPGLARLGVAAHLRRREAVERLVIGRMHGDELALQMGRQLGDLDTGHASRRCP